MTVDETNVDKMYLSTKWVVYKMYLSTKQVVDYMIVDEMNTTPIIYMKTNRIIICFVLL